jgi:hypothetical protein
LPLPCRGPRLPEALAVLAAGMGDSSPHTFSQDFAFEGGELFLRQQQASTGFIKDQYLCSQNRSNDLLKPIEIH